MKTTNALLTAVAALCCVTAGAQPKGPTVPYNEAVKVIGGQRQVQLPPMSNDETVHLYQHGFSKGDRYMAIYMVEGPTELVECTDPVFHPKACRPSTYGKSILGRTWVVLRNGSWQMCLGPKRVEACKTIMYPKPGAASYRPTTAFAPVEKH